ncbi:metallo-beta-lactamase domain-containing protein 1-like [Glandiceps talaboti]
MYTVTVLKEGYAKKEENGDQLADGTITLIKGPHNIIVDTGNPWDGEVVIQGLKTHNLCTDDIEYVVGTHGHSDHIGNLNLFKKAVHIVGFDICSYDRYISHPFQEGKNYKIDEKITVIPTPGHTLSHVSVAVETSDLGTVVVAGDVFECEEDLTNAEIWKEISENIKLQEESRKKILEIADYIIPGHGKMFEVLESMKNI